jgi:hypothetical protein
MDIHASLMAPFDGPAAGDPGRVGAAFARAFFRTGFPVAVFCDLLDGTERRCADADDARSRGANPEGVVLYGRAFRLAALLEFRRLMQAARTEGGRA